MKQEHLLIEGPSNLALNSEIGAAMLLAMNVHAPTNGGLPAGVSADWNYAVRKGAFDDAKDVGDLAIAYLEHRATMLRESLDRQ